MGVHEDCKGRLPTCGSRHAAGAGAYVGAGSLPQRKIVRFVQSVHLLLALEPSRLPAGLPPRPRRPQLERSTPAVHLSRPLAIACAQRESGNSGLCLQCLQPPKADREASQQGPKHYLVTAVAEERPHRSPCHIVCLQENHNLAVEDLARECGQAAARSDRHWLEIVAGCPKSCRHVVRHSSPVPQCCVPPART